MLTQVVLIQQFLLHWADTGIHDFRVEGHEKPDLPAPQRYGQRCGGVGAPGERAVGVHQNGGNIVGVLALEGLDNHVAGFQLILFADFGGGHFPGAGDFPIEVVPMGGVP